MHTPARVGLRGSVCSPGRRGIARVPVVGFSPARHPTFAVPFDSQAFDSQGSAATAPAPGRATSRTRIHLLAAISPARLQLAQAPWASARAEPLDSVQRPGRQSNIIDDERGYQTRLRKARLRRRRCDWWRWDAGRRPRAAEQRAPIIARARPVAGQQIELKFDAHPALWLQAPVRADELRAG